MSPVGPPHVHSGAIRATPHPGDLTNQLAISSRGLLDRHQAAVPNLMSGRGKAADLTGGAAAAS